jgi:hypothetical protein
MKNQMKNRMKLGDVNTSPSLYMVFGPKVAVWVCTGTFVSGCCVCLVFAPFFLNQKVPHLHATTTTTCRVFTIQVFNLLVHFPSVKPTLIFAGLQGQEGKL